MKFIRKTKWVVVALLLIVIAGWFYIRYDNRAFLRYGVLHINKFPNSLKIINDEFSGWTDQQYEYDISIDPGEMNKLLSGRRYIEQLDIRLASITPNGFRTNTCYTSGDLKNGLVTIYVNADRSKAYIVYDIN